MQPLRTQRDYGMKNTSVKSILDEARKTMSSVVEKVTRIAGGAPEDPDSTYGEHNKTEHSMALSKARTYLMEHPDGHYELEDLVKTDPKHQMELQKFKENKGEWDKYHAELEKVRGDAAAEKEHEESGDDEDKDLAYNKTGDPATDAKNALAAYLKVKGKGAGAPVTDAALAFKKEYEAFLEEAKKHGDGFSNPYEDKFYGQDPGWTQDKVDEALGHVKELDEVMGMAAPEKKQKAPKEKPPVKEEAKPVPVKKKAPVKKAPVEKKEQPVPVKKGPVNPVQLPPSYLDAPDAVPGQGGLKKKPKITPKTKPTFTKGPSSGTPLSKKTPAIQQPAVPKKKVPAPATPAPAPAVKAPAKKKKKVVKPGKDVVKKKGIQNAFQLGAPHKKVPNSLKVKKSFTTKSGKQKYGWTSNVGDSTTVSGQIYEIYQGENGGKIYMAAVERMLKMRGVPKEQWSDVKWQKSNYHLYGEHPDDQDKVLSMHPDTLATDIGLIKQLISENEIGEDTMKELAGFKKTLGKPGRGRDIEKLKQDFLANMNPLNYESYKEFDAARQRIQGLSSGDFAMLLASIMSDDDDDSFEQELLMHMKVMRNKLNKA